MSENNQGKVVPFALSATRIRRRAEERAKRGQTLEAIELYRRAAQEDEMPTGWLYLARLLRSCGSYEQAIQVLCRMAARPDMPPDAWLELAKNHHALGRTNGVRDSLYRLLEEDPYSDSADEAHDMLADMEAENVSREPFRLAALSRRAMHTWYRGERKLAVRRFRRAARMSSRPGSVYITVAMLQLASPQPEQAVKWVTKALHREPKDIRVRTSASVCVGLRGGQKLAVRMLAACMKDVRTVQEEALFITAANTLKAWRLKRRFLIERLKMKPHRAELLMELADEYVRSGEIDGATRIWDTVLRIDPMHVKAQQLARLAKTTPECFDTPGMAERTVTARMQRKQTELVLHAMDGRLTEALEPGSETRMALDWCFVQPEGRLSPMLLSMLAQSDEEKAREYLNELLTNPNAHPNARQMALVELAKGGDFAPRPVLMGYCIATAQTTQREETPKAMKKRFLMLVLLETARHRASTEMVRYAASLWRVMSPEMRMDACGAESYAYVKAAEIMCLRELGRDEALACIVKQLNVSYRRIGRVIARLMNAGIAVKGVNDDEVY